MTEYALRLVNSTDTRERSRQLDTLGLFAKGPLQARSGVRNDGGGAVTAVNGTMTVSVTNLSAWIDGGTSTAQGGYVFVSDATKVLTISDGHASLSRTDTIVAEVLDDTHDGSGSTLARLRVVTGTAGAGAPSLPTTCIPLRDITVPATTSAGTGGLSASNLGSDRRTWLVSLGGILPVASATERDALSLVKSLTVFRLDTGKLQTYDGTTWQTIGYDAGDTGWIALTYSNGWVDLAGASEPAASYRVLNGICYLRGRIQSGTITDGTVMFTLPVGARPTANLVNIPAVRGTTAADPWKLTVQSNGQCKPVALSAATSVSLNGVSFPVT